MKTMIQAYETTRTQLLNRIHELNAALRDDTLMHRDREHLLLRKELLTIDSIELLHAIADMKCR